MRIQIYFTQKITAETNHGALHACDEGIHSPSFGESDVVVDEVEGDHEDDLVQLEAVVFTSK